MPVEEFATYREIKSQTDAWAQAVELTSAWSLPAAGNYDQVVFTGCGSTYYLSIAAAALYQELTGCPARAVPGGELVLNPKTVLSDQKTLLVAVSRSGTTSETLKAVQNFRADKLGDVLAISNYQEALSGLADVNIVIEKGQEQSVAQTRAFASMYVAACLLGARMAGRNDLVEAMGRKLPEYADRPVFIGWGLRDFVFDRHFLDGFRAALPDAEVHAFEDANHYVLEDKAEVLVPAIRRFLDTHPIG